MIKTEDGAAGRTARRTKVRLGIWQEPTSGHDSGHDSTQDIEQNRGQNI